MVTFENIANGLELKLGEDFKIGCLENINEGIFRFMHNTIMYKEDANANWTKSEHIDEIISGEVRIIKLPWKPEIREKYWNYYFYVNPDHSVGYDCYHMLYYDNAEDRKKIQGGNIFETLEECEIKAIELSKVIENAIEMVIGVNVCNKI